MSDARTTNNARANNPENAAINTGTARDVKTGRFLTGNNGGGRPKGSRNRLGEAFLQDAYEQWKKSGAAALEAMVKDDPGGFVKVIANLMPREIDSVIDLNSDLFREAKDFAEAYRIARAHLGIDGPKPTPLIELQQAHDDDT